jgi:hypothetical protein
VTNRQSRAAAIKPDKIIRGEKAKETQNRGAKEPTSSRERTARKAMARERKEKETKGRGSLERGMRGRETSRISRHPLSSKTAAANHLPASRLPAATNLRISRPAARGDRRQIGRSPPSNQAN